MRAQLTPAPGSGQAAPGARPARLLRGMHEPERWRGEAGEHQRMGGDGVGDAFDAAGRAGHQHMPDVAFVLMRAGRAHRGPSVPAADVGDPVRLRTRAVGAKDFTGRRVDGVAAADQPHRPGALPNLSDLAQPAAQVGPGQPTDDLCLDGCRPALTGQQ